MGGGMSTCASSEPNGTSLPRDKEADSNKRDNDGLTSVQPGGGQGKDANRPPQPGRTSQANATATITTNNGGSNDGSNNGSNPSKPALEKNESMVKEAAKKRIWVLGQTADIKSAYEFGKVLGKGGSGTTRLVIDQATGTPMACKSISKRKMTTQDDIEDVRREVQIMNHLAGHANIVRLRAAFEDKQYVHLVMDLCSGGELFDRIIERGFFTELQAATTFYTMVSVIAHCHNAGVIHRDLKPENFLLSNKSDNAVLLATDFGLSVFFKEDQVFEDIVGSAYYVAPEVLRKSYGKEADIWSLGVLLYILLCGVPPFYGETDQAIFAEVLSGKLDFYSPPWPKISDPAKDCVRRMLERDPKRRATASEILNHPWVKPGGVAKPTPLNSPLPMSKLGTNRPISPQDFSF